MFQLHSGWNDPRNKKIFWFSRYQAIVIKIDQAITFCKTLCVIFVNNIFIFCKIYCANGYPALRNKEAAEFLNTDFRIWIVVKIFISNYFCQYRQLQKKWNRCQFWRLLGSDLLFAHSNYLHYIKWIIYGYQKFILQSSTIPLYYENYSLVEVTYLLIRFNKTTLFSW